MKLSDFQYELPEELIAQHPLKERDQARLLVVNREKGSITHDVFANIGEYLPPESALVLNDSKVVHARLLAKRKTGAEVEIFLLKQLDDYSYEVLMRPTKRLKEGEKIHLNEGSLVATIVDKENRIVSFNKKDMKDYLEKQGHIPLPPYIRRGDTEEDKEYYQTVYAKNEGSVAAPTAGLHFTKKQLEELKKAGHSIETITLHINYGTFKPVEEEDITKHKMHQEEFSVSEKTWASLQRAKGLSRRGQAPLRDQGQRVVAVGTTSCRVLETLAGVGAQRAVPLRGTTDKFIYPGYQFQMTDALITNFHLPGSTLLMLVCAFAGRELLMKAYEEAIERKYRFYSYGDGMVIL